MMPGRRARTERTHSDGHEAHRRIFAVPFGSDAIPGKVFANGLSDFFSAVWTRDNAAGIKAVPLARAIELKAPHFSLTE